MNIQTNNGTDPATGNFALFNLSFRIFFLSAGLFSIISIGLWSAVYLFGVQLSIQNLSSSQWHAHEMIYGFAFAVIAGFLLTAAKNWTGIQTIHGKPLALMFALWALARILFLVGTPYIELAAIFDTGFSLIFIVALAHPILKAKQWKQLALVFKIVLLAIFNILFYLGATGTIMQGVNWGIYGGLFLVISLILMLGRRVVPFFIEKGVNRQVKLRNSKWIDLGSLVLFLSFTIVEVFFTQPALSAYLALILFAINARRLMGWYTPGIWQKSLLWSLYLAFWFLTVGFALLAASYFLGINKSLAIHAFAVGGIGAMTLAMMSRVALGHSGRGIHSPPRAMAYAFGLLLIGAVVRVFLPLFDTGHYTLWVGISQLLWVVAYSIFGVIYLPILSKARIDGRPG